MSFDPSVWFQTSNRHRAVARLPEGKTGKQALAEKSDNPSYTHMDEGSAGDQYLRVYAPKEDQRDLTREEWAVYKKAGGTTYMFAEFEKHRAGP